jgi:hypothetical protein
VLLAVLVRIHVRLGCGQLPSNQERRFRYGQPRQAVILMDGCQEAPAMTPILLLIALATPVPNVDLESICHSARANALPEEQARAYESCVNEEKAAREEVQKRWLKASGDARAECAPLKGIPTSYVAMLTCLDMQPGGDFDAGKPK